MATARSSVIERRQSTILRNPASDSGDPQPEPLPPLSDVSAWSFWGADFIREDSGLAYYHVHAPDDPNNTTGLEYFYSSIAIYPVSDKAKTAVSPWLTLSLGIYQPNCVKDIRQMTNTTLLDLVQLSDSRIVTVFPVQNPNFGRVTIIFPDKRDFFKVQVQVCKSPPAAKDGSMYWRKAYDVSQDPVASTPGRWVGKLLPFDQPGPHRLLIEEFEPAYQATSATSYDFGSDDFSNPVQLKRDTCTGRRRYFDIINLPPPS